MSAPIFALVVLQSGTVGGLLDFVDRPSIPSEAEIVITMDRPISGRYVTEAELRMRADGRSNDLSWALPAPRVYGQHRFRARVIHLGRTLYEEDAPVLLSNVSRTVRIRMVRPGEGGGGNPGWGGESGQIDRVQELTNSRWRVETLEGSRVVGRAPTIDFASGGRMSGSGGVNRFVGRWSGFGPAIRVTPDGNTRMAPEFSADGRQERRFLELLERADRASFTPGRMTLTYRGRALLVLSQQR